MDKGRVESIRRVPEQICVLISGHKKCADRTYTRRMHGGAFQKEGSLPLGQLAYLYYMTTS